MQITSSSSCSDHLMSPQVGVLAGGRCWTSPRAGQHGEEPLSDGVTSFSKCAPVTLVTLVLYLLPGVSEGEGGVCKSSSDAAKSLQSCLTLCDLTDGSPQRSSIPGALQARTLEWVAISFSGARMLSCFSRAQLCVTPWTGSSVHWIL